VRGGGKWEVGGRLVGGGWERRVNIVVSEIVARERAPQ